MFNRLKSIFRSRTPPKQLVRARFDAAQTTRDNWRHWSAADHLSADMEAAPEVRRTLRMRSRYEVANNSYARADARKRHHRYGSETADAIRRRDV